MEDLDKRNLLFVDSLVERGVLKKAKLIEAFRKVPRHRFARGNAVNLAYYDAPLFIKENSTISQPSTVATMLELIDLKEGDSVLEIGTGSGWNAALIAYCVGKSGRVVSLEIDKELVVLAIEKIAEFHMNNVKIVCSDGINGYIKGSPYDKIMYTAASDKVPNTVLEQLSIGGTLLAPLGPKEMQVLTMIKRLGGTKFDTHHFGYFQFVPMRH